MQLTLALYGFLLPAKLFGENARELSVPALSHVLNRAQSTWLQPLGYYEAIMQVALESAPTSALTQPTKEHVRAATFHSSLAAYRLCAEVGEWIEGRYLCMDPVSFAVERRGLRLLDPAVLALTPDEDAKLRQSCAPLFAILGTLGSAAEFLASRKEEMNLIAASSSAPNGKKSAADRQNEEHTVGHWYLHLRDEQIKFAAFACYPPPLESIDRLMEPHEHPLDERLRHILSQAEILLYAHPINSQRKAEGKPLVASLWPWGGEGLLSSGAAEKKIEYKTQQATLIMSDDAVLRGYALAHGMHAKPVTQDFSTVQNLAQDYAHCLCVPEFLLAPARSWNIANWRLQIEYLEKCWLKPALAALRNNEISSLRIVAGNEERTLLARIDKWDLLKFWRTSLSLAEILS